MVVTSVLHHNDMTLSLNNNYYQVICTSYIYCKHQKCFQRFINVAMVTVYS